MLVELPVVEPVETSSVVEPVETSRWSSLSRPSRWSSLSRPPGGRARRDPFDQQPRVVLAAPLELGHDDLLHVAAGHADPEAVRPGLQDRHLVRRTAQLEVDRVPDAVLDLRAAAVGALEQAGDLELRLVLVGLDAGGDERDAGVLVGDQAAGLAGAVDPGGVRPVRARRATVDDLGLVEQVEDEALVGGAALDDDGGLGHGAAQPGERLVAGAAVGDDLGDHRVELRGDGVALADAGVDADAGAGGQLEQGDAARGRREVAVGVLGVEPRLDGVALLGRLLALEAAAGRHVDLRLDEVEVRGELGDGVLDLEAGVDLEEGEGLLARVVEELHSSGAAVVDGDSEPLGRGLELVGLGLVEQRGGGLLDDLLVASLHGAVAYADGPRGALAVGDDLDLDVAGAGDEALEEDDAAAEGALGLVAGALVGVLELGRGLDLADAAPAAAGGGLEHEGVADALRGLERLLEGLDPAAGPGRNRYADLLGDQLGADLVAELAHGLAAGPDEGDAEPLAEVREVRVLGDEAPADPDGVGLGGDQGALEGGVVEVGPARGRAERVGLVGLAGEHGRPLLVDVEGDRADLLPALGVEVAHGVDEPHGGFTAVDDGDALEHVSLLRRLGEVPSSEAVTGRGLRASHQPEHRPLLWEPSKHRRSQVSGSSSRGFPPQSSEATVRMLV